MNMNSKRSAIFNSTHMNIFIFIPSPGSFHPVHLHGGGSDHVDSPFRSTSMKLVSDSGVGLTPELLHSKRACGAR